MLNNLIKNPNRSRAAGYFLILLGINIVVELRGIVPKQEIKWLKVIMILTSIILALFLIISAYKISLLSTKLSADQQKVFDFLRNKADLPEDYTTSEKSHLLDVKKVMQKTDYVFYFVFFISAFIIIYYYKNKQMLKEILYYSGFITLTIIVIILLGIIINFNFMFEIFHLLLFPQGNWQFPLESLLIRTFPLDFFVWMGAKLIFFSLVFGGGVMIISNYFSKKMIIS